jgi:hypothetical protein
VFAERGFRDATGEDICRRAQEPDIMSVNNRFMWREAGAGFKR